MIRVIACVLVAGLAGASIASAQTMFTLPDTMPLGKVERTLLRLEQTRSALIAKHDTLGLRRVYAEDFQGVAASGLVVDRSRLMNVFMRDDPSLSFEIDQMDVRPLTKSRDTAVVTGRLSTRRVAGELVARSRFIHVYVWREGRWQILRAQGTAVTD